MMEHVTATRELAWGGSQCAGVSHSTVWQLICKAW